MLTLPASVNIWLAAEPVDMRKGFDGLSALVRNGFGADVYSGDLFVFLSRRRELAKVLFWDGGGFVLVCKRLERSRFRRLTASGADKRVRLDAVQLAMLLDGIEVSRVRRPERWRPSSAAA
jgi:transposase